MTSVNGVSRRPADRNYKPLTWEITVSEVRLHPKNHCVLAAEFALGHVA